MESETKTLSFFHYRSWRNLLHMLQLVFTINHKVITEENSTFANSARKIHCHKTVWNYGTASTY